MTKKKTAISIEEPLLAEIEALAEELNVSRSRLFTLAAREYIETLRNRQIFDSLNAACQAEPDHSESSVREMMKQKQYRMVKDQW
jgi:metal-responsive CopG/Arc/MetJ family transcriptional regulator